VDPREPAVPARLERRDLLRLAGAVGLGSLLGSELQAAPSVSWAGSCTLTPSAIAGPFYLDLDLLRSDITEGRPGFPLDLYLQVVRLSDCLPIAGAVVDLWHASAGGRYSGIASEGTAGQTFLRGIQITPSSGIVHFRTIYPGWYPGRTTHLHLKVNPDLATELTTQLYFRDEVSRSIYGLPPYSLRGQNPTTNALDGSFLPETLLSTLELGRAGSLPPFPGPRRLVASLKLVIA
jgi:protocatechuate 3,4-dioxygenase beta subunit